MRQAIRKVRSSSCSFRLRRSSLRSMGWGPVLAGMSWPAGYLFIGVPTLVLLYLLGWLLSRAAKAVRRA